MLGCPYLQPVTWWYDWRDYLQYSILLLVPDILQLAPGDVIGYTAWYGSHAPTSGCTLLGLTLVRPRLVHGFWGAWLSLPSARDVEAGTPFLL